MFLRSVFFLGTNHFLLPAGDMSHQGMKLPSKVIFDLCPTHRKAVVHNDENSDQNKKSPQLNKSKSLV